MISVGNSTMTITNIVRMIIWRPRLIVTLAMEEEDGLWSKGDKMDLLTLTEPGWSMKMDSES